MEVGYAAMTISHNLDPIYIYGLAAEKITRATAGLGGSSHDDYLVRCRQDRLILYRDVDNANIFTNRLSNMYHQQRSWGKNDVGGNLFFSDSKRNRR